MVEEVLQAYFFAHLEDRFGELVDVVLQDGLQRVIEPKALREVRNLEGLWHHQTSALDDVVDEDLLVQVQDLHTNEVLDQALDT